jgi:hypothetical protein
MALGFTTARSERRLDRKLASILAGTYTVDDFIIADAKDADMAFGVQAPGLVPGDPLHFKSRSAYLDDMRDLVRQGELDILLTSASNGERLAGDGSLDDLITLAVRGNDATDIWFPRGARYAQSASRPFRTANLSVVRNFCDLVLYSITFVNDLERDLDTLEAYAMFRRQAAEAGIRHFLEVFNPNAECGLEGAELGAFVNDSIIRSLAGVTSAERPIFLKMAYNGRQVIAELAGHDSSLVVGILGGAAGTTRDTFELLHRAENSGARVALFGRKIQRAESQLDLVAMMRPVIRGEITPADAVRAYHDAIGRAGLSPVRSLDADLQITDSVLLAE